MEKKRKRKGVSVKPVERDRNPVLLGALAAHSHGFVLEHCSLQDAPQSLWVEKLQATVVDLAQDETFSDQLSGLERFLSYAKELLGQDAELADDSGVIIEDVVERDMDKLCLAYTASHGPLFSCLRKESLLHPEFIAPMPFSAVSVVVSRSAMAPKFAYISPAFSSVAHMPTRGASLIPPVQMVIPSMQWLHMNNFSSFAPCRDGSLEIMPQRQASKVWWERRGFSQLYGWDDQCGHFNEELILDWDPEDLEDFRADEGQAEDQNDSGLTAIGEDLVQLHHLQDSRFLEKRQVLSNDEFSLARSIEQRLEALLADVPPSLVSLKPTESLTVKERSYYGSMAVTVDDSRTSMGSHYGTMDTRFDYSRRPTSLGKPYQR